MTAAISLSDRSVPGPFSQLELAVTCLDICDFLLHDWEDNQDWVGSQKSRPKPLVVKKTKVPTSSIPTSLFTSMPMYVQSKVAIFYEIFLCLWRLDDQEIMVRL